MSLHQPHFLWSPSLTAYYTNMPPHFPHPTPNISSNFGAFQSFTSFIFESNIEQFPNKVTPMNCMLELPVIAVAIGLHYFVLSALVTTFSSWRILFFPPSQHHFFPTINRLTMPRGISGFSFWHCIVTKQMRFFLKKNQLCMSVKLLNACFPSQAGYKNKRPVPNSALFFVALNEPHTFQHCSPENLQWCNRRQ